MKAAQTITERHCVGGDLVRLRVEVIAEGPTGDSCRRVHEQAVAALVARVGHETREVSPVQALGAAARDSRE